MSVKKAKLSSPFVKGDREGFDTLVKSDREGFALYFFPGSGGRIGGPESGTVASQRPSISSIGSLASRFWRRQGMTSTTSKPQVCMMRSRLAAQDVVPLPLPPA